MELLAVSKANTLIEDIPVRRVIMGEAYLERKQTAGSQRFVCLIGEEGKVLLTFSTANLSSNREGRHSPRFPSTYGRSGSRCAWD